MAAEPPTPSPSLVTAATLPSRAAENEPTAADHACTWSLQVRVLFRFFFLYWLLYCLPFPLDIFGDLFEGGEPPAVLAGLQWLADEYENLWQHAVPWIGERVFKVTITVRPNGSGDTTYNFVEVFAIAMLALVGTLVWSWLDRDRRGYPWLFAGLHVYLRYFLAWQLLSYGFIKLFPLQMPAPTLDRLLQPIGDASPMGLLWTFLGVSSLYESFTGLGEIVAGLLLTTRRTALLGSLLALGVMLHVAMLNFAYDVPVKLMSSHLAGMALFLMMPHGRRLANFFLMNRPVPAAPLAPWFARPGLNVTVVVLRTLVIGGLLTQLFLGAWESWQARGQDRSPFHGIWFVEELTVNGRVVPPSLLELERWRWVTFDWANSMAIQNVQGRRERFGLRLDQQHRTMELTDWATFNSPTTITYAVPAEGCLELGGKLHGKEFKARLRR